MKTSKVKTSNCLGRKLQMFRHVLASSTQPETWSIHVVVRTKTAKKCTKMKNARAGCGELLFLLIRAIVLLRSRGPLRRPCVSSLFCRCRRRFSTTVDSTTTMAEGKNIIGLKRKNTSCCTCGTRFSTFLCRTLSNTRTHEIIRFAVLTKTRPYKG